MEKTRVPKGERYWYIKTNDTYTEIRVDWAIEGLSPFVDASRFERGNYFTTPEEAVAMALKLRAVLNGAEVIEMPSEEEIQKVLAEKIPIRSGRSYADALHCCWFEDGIHWLRDNKIVK